MSQNSMGINNVIKYIGTLLAEQLDIKPMAGIGFIRLAIRDDFGSSEGLNLNKFRHVLKNGLKKRLEKLNIPDLDKVIPNLEEIIIKDQSLINMVQF